jgi:hypothetical protein
MGKLAKTIDNNVIIAKRGVYGPGFTILVSEAKSDFGWTYYDEDVEQDDFALPWIEGNVYELGDIVSHDDKAWRSLLAHNVWEPGISGWREAATDFAQWLQPTGAHDAYAKDALVTHNEKIWRSLIDANTWEPGVSGWRESVLMPPSGEVAPPAWVQPSGAHDAYNTGDRVTHNNQIWVSTVDANTWEPGVYGWEAE